MSRAGTLASTVLSAARIALLNAVLLPVLLPVSLTVLPPGLRPAPPSVRVATTGAASEVPDATGAVGAELRLRGVPAAWMLARGRVLVLRPHRLEIALDGRVRRVVAVRQPVDLAALPALVHDPAYLALVPGRRGERRIHLGAVLAQRPGTTLTATGPTVELGDTGGAGPARLTGTRARLVLTGASVLRTGPPGRPPVAAGLRYLHGSDLQLTDATLSGLGGVGMASLRADGGSTVALRRVALVYGGGVDVRAPASLTVDHLVAAAVTSALLDVTGGRGARLNDLRSTAAKGAVLRLRGTAGTHLDGLSSEDDDHALVTSDVEDLEAAGVRTRGSGLVLGGRGIALAAPDVDAPADALRVTGEVAVTGGVLHGQGRAVTAADRGRAVLRGVRTVGAVRGDVRNAPAGPDGADAAASGAGFWDGPLRGPAVVVGLVLVAGLVEVLRGRSRRHGTLGAASAPAPAAAPDVDRGELVLDLGERAAS